MSTKHAAAETAENKEVKDLATVPVPETTAVANTLEDLFSEDRGAGLENAGADAFQIPFLQILQKGSPQVSKANVKYIKGAEPGAVLHTVTGQVYKCVEGDDSPGILFIPCGYRRQFVRWKNRDAGGGLVCHYGEHDPTLKKFSTNARGQLYDEATTDVVIDTVYHFGLLVPEDGFPEMVVISMYSTQLKKSRIWNTNMRKITFKDKGGKLYNPPTYSHVYRLKTIGEAKDTYDWFGWKIANEGPVQDVELYNMAKRFSAEIRDGRVKVSAPPQDFDAEGQPESNKEEVPF